MSADRHIELIVPGATSDALREWAQKIVEANPVVPITSIFTPEMNLDITDYPFMGVELTFQSERQQLLTLALFAQIPNEKERETMEADGVPAGGL